MLHRPFELRGLDGGVRILELHPGCAPYPNIVLSNNMVVRRGCFDDRTELAVGRAPTTTPTLPSSPGGEHEYRNVPPTSRNARKVCARALPPDPKRKPIPHARSSGMSCEPKSGARRSIAPQPEQHRSSQTPVLAVSCLAKLRRCRDVSPLQAVCTEVLLRCSPGPSRTLKAWADDPPD